MKEKMFEFTVFGSLLRQTDDVVLNNKYFRFGFNCMAKSWRDALYSVFYYCFPDYIENNCPDGCYIILGISHYSSILCNNKLVDFNYVHKVISKDKFLSEHFWY